MTSSASSAAAPSAGTSSTETDSASGKSRKRRCRRTTTRRASSSKKTSSVAPKSSGKHLAQPILLHGRREAQQRRQLVAALDLAHFARHEQRRFLHGAFAREHAAPVAADELAAQGARVEPPRELIRKPDQDAMADRLGRGRLFVDAAAAVVVVLARAFVRHATAALGLRRPVRSCSARWRCPEIARTTRPPAARPARGCPADGSGPDRTARSRRNATRASAKRSRTRARRRGHPRGPRPSGGLRCAGAGFRVWVSAASSATGRTQPRSRAARSIRA